MTTNIERTTASKVPYPTHDMSYRVIIGGEPRRVIVHRKTTTAVEYQFATDDGTRVHPTDRTVRLSYRWHRVAADGVTITEASSHRYEPFPGADPADGEGEGH